MKDKLQNMKLTDFVNFLCDERIELWDIDSSQSIGIFDLETIIKYSRKTNLYNVYCVSAENDVLVLYVSTN